MAASSELGEVQYDASEEGALALLRDVISVVVAAQPYAVSYHIVESVVRRRTINLSETDAVYFDEYLPNQNPEAPVLRSILTWAKKQAGNNGMHYDQVIWAIGTGGQVLVGVQENDRYQTSWESQLLEEYMRPENTIVGATLFANNIVNQLILP